jgi:16S rRNA (guanine527-N7)-methyltransferase
MNAGAATAESRQLRTFAAQLEVALSAPQAGRLLRLLDELQHWNRAYNLTAVLGREAMMTHHLLDSLAASADLHGERIADVGTGAGFPGLPLAVLHPERQFTLIDATAKKIRFVAHAARVLDLHNVTPWHGRAEALVTAQPFDTVIARAVAALPELLAAVRGLCGSASRVVALKGRYPARELAELPLGWRLLSARAISVPGLAAERHILRLTPPVLPPSDAAGALRGA